MMQAVIPHFFSAENSRQVGIQAKIPFGKRTNPLTR